MNEQRYEGREAYCHENGVGPNPEAELRAQLVGTFVGERPLFPEREQPLALADYSNLELDPRDLG